VRHFKGPDDVKLHQIHVFVLGRDERELSDPIEIEDLGLDVM
jgi:hypothetical protein